MSKRSPVKINKSALSKTPKGQTHPSSSGTGKSKRSEGKIVFKDDKDASQEYPSSTEEDDKDDKPYKN